MAGGSSPNHLSPGPVQTWYTAGDHDGLIGRQLQVDARRAALVSILKALVMGTLSQRIGHVHPLESARRTEVFRITLSPGGWRVCLNGDLFGDYLTRGNAVRAAYAGARIEEGRGRLAQVFASPGTMALPHHEPHFGA